MGSSSAVVFGIVLAVVTLRLTLAAKTWQELMVDDPNGNWYKSFVGDNPSTWRVDIDYTSAYYRELLNLTETSGPITDVCKNSPKLKGNAHAYAKKMLRMTYGGKEVEYWTQMVAFAGDPATFNTNASVYLNDRTNGNSNIDSGPGHKLMAAGRACCDGDAPMVAGKWSDGAGPLTEGTIMINPHSYKAYSMMWLDSFGVPNHYNPNLQPMIRACFQDLQCKSFVDWYIFNTDKIPNKWMVTAQWHTLPFPVGRSDFLDTEIVGTTEQKKFILNKFGEQTCVGLLTGGGVGDYWMANEFLELLANACPHDEVCAAMIGVPFKKEVCRASPWPASDAIKDNDAFIVTGSPLEQLGPICPYLRTNGADGPYRCNKYSFRQNWGKVVTDQHVELIWENCPKTCPQVVERIAWCQKRYTNDWPFTPQHAYTCGKNSSGQACPTETCFSHLTGQCLGDLPYKVCTPPFHSWCPAGAADKVYDNSWYLASQVAIASADAAFLKNHSSTTTFQQNSSSAPTDMPELPESTSYAEPKAIANAGVVLVLVMWLF
jgi:hypothetical protein